MGVCCYRDFTFWLNPRSSEQLGDRTIEYRVEKGKTLHSSYLKIISANKSQGWYFQFGSGEGNVKLTKPITLKPFKSIHINKLSKVKGHHKGVHAVTEPLAECFSKYVLVAAAFTTMNANSGKVDVALGHFSARTMKVMAGTKRVRVNAANHIPPMQVPKENNTPKDVWVPSKSNSNRQGTWVGMGVLPEITKSSVMYYPDHRWVDLIPA